MQTDQEQIRALIDRWAEAVHIGDMDRVLQDHAEDIVMFDVPPPYEGVRGLGAYRRTWPPFFEWQSQGATFDIESLDVIAGDDVAFAYALLRCGTKEEFTADPDNRLRLTLGLRKEEGRWVVVHEHHSFPHVSPEPAASGEEEVRRVHEDCSRGTAAKDLDALMAGIADDVVSYEHEEPLQYTGVQAVRESCARNLDAAGDTRVSLDIPDLTILVRDDLAVAWGLNHVQVTEPGKPAADSWSRGTRVFQRRDGAWLMIHQHVSLPYDPSTGEAKPNLHP
ncbi:nuclear transport factor 2 family protein [Actinomadura sp. 7K507]|uniref:nuclear transport factor 2 family protein n=1 Tax=Actinomadura sp. 7K507 TaxID=2530365 RepID=UPI00104EDCD2|nr:nuclear transport factor 2 family protein [Actinomadura sp. 7K507]TDC97807.1 SgcJ/EcaC family oxidoreductase [Actinomadura sp. 7K507]